VQRAGRDPCGQKVRQAVAVGAANVFRAIPPAHVHCSCRCFGPLVSVAEQIAYDSSTLCGSRIVRVAWLELESYSKGHKKYDTGRGRISRLKGIGDSGAAKRYGIAGGSSEG
jgi:hypothetical protein